jgi:hypothetical protein
MKRFLPISDEFCCSSMNTKTATGAHQHLSPYETFPLRWSIAGYVSICVQLYYVGFHCVTTCFGLHGHLQVRRIFYFHMLEGFCSETVKTNTIKLHADGNITCNTQPTLQSSRMLKYIVLVRWSIPFSRLSVYFILYRRLLITFLHSRAPRRRRRLWFTGKRRAHRDTTVIVVSWTWHHTCYTFVRCYQLFLVGRPKLWLESQFLLTSACIYVCCV